MHRNYSNRPIALRPEPGNVNITGERAGTEHRERHLAHLSEVYAGGYLSDNELEARRDAITGATTKEELRYLVSDLPSLIAPAKVSKISKFRLWRRLNGIQRLSVLIGTTALSLMVMIVPAVIVTGATTYPPIVGAPIGFGGFFLGLAGIVTSVFVAVTDDQITNM